jgi:hypothetical protein
LINIGVSFLFFDARPSVAMLTYDATKHTTAWKNGLLTIAGFSSVSKSVRISHKNRIRINQLNGILKTLFAQIDA